MQQEKIPLNGFRYSLPALCCSISEIFNYQVADIGDVVASLYNVKASCDSITEQYK